MNRVLEAANIIEHLPPVTKNILEMKVIAHVDDKELNQLYQYLYNLMSDQFIYEATEVGIRRWEKILKIKPSGDLESRRFTILSRLNVRIPYTMNMLHERLASMFGSDYTLRLVNDTATLKVTIPNVDAFKFQETKEMLEVIVPANLYIDLGMME